MLLLGALYSVAEMIVIDEFFEGEGNESNNQPHTQLRP